MSVWFLKSVCLISKMISVWFQRWVFDFKDECLISKMSVWFQRWMFDFKGECLISKTRVWFQKYMFDFWMALLISKMPLLISKMSVWFLKSVCLISKMSVWFPKFIGFIITECLVSKIWPSASHVTSCSSEVNYGCNFRSRNSWKWYILLLSMFVDPFCSVTASNSALAVVQ